MPNVTEERSPEEREGAGVIWPSVRLLHGWSRLNQRTTQDVSNVSFAFADFGGLVGETETDDHAWLNESAQG
jgi:hypothetical protein